MILYYANKKPNTAQYPECTSEVKLEVPYFLKYRKGDDEEVQYVGVFEDKYIEIEGFVDTDDPEGSNTDVNIVSQKYDDPEDDSRFGYAHEDGSEVITEGEFVSVVQTIKTSLNFLYEYVEEHKKGNNV